MLAAGREDARLRFTLGNAYLKEHPALAATHLARAVELNPEYSAAWKIYAKALAACGRTDDARKAYTQGIDTATRNGDIQAAKEMRVFQNRLPPKSDKGGKKGTHLFFPEKGKNKCVPFFPIEGGQAHQASAPVFRSRVPVRRESSSRLWRRIYSSSPWFIFVHTRGS